MKGLKTTIIAFIILILGAGLTVALIYGKIAPSSYDRAMMAIGVLGAMVIGFLSKDASSSHTFDVNASTGDHPDPDKEEK